MRSATTMYPLPAHTVGLVLQYISPLTDPLPPHLLSTPLRQRHHFLQISTTSPLDYLCWPSPDNLRIIDLLDHLSLLSDHPSYLTRYTSDPDSTFAHAQVSLDAQGLRLVFHWDNNTWKYHNLCSMPFPSPSFLTPEESFSSVAMPGHLCPDQLNSDNDDSYWASYGEAVDDLTSSSPSQNVPDIVGEDAYWAQYASVQGYLLHSNSSRIISQSNLLIKLGSADSTVPSPLPAHRKLRPVINSNDTECVSFSPQDEPIVDVPVDAIHSRPPLGPSSPSTLAHLLSSILPRNDVCSLAPDDPHSSQSPSAGSTDPSPETLADSELVTHPLMPDEYTDAGIVSPVAVKANGIPPSKYKPPPLELRDKALTRSIKGLYSLWRSGRKEELDKDRDVFLQIVREAVAHE